MAKLIITQDGQDKIYEIVDEEFTIGSGPDADLVLNDEGISNVHIAVKKVRGGFQLIDMETKSGTMVNGSQVNSHTFQNGDTVEIGEIRMTYIGGGPKRAAAGRGKARGGKKTNIERTSRSHYRRDTWESKAGGAGMAAIAIGALLILGLIGWIAFSNSEPKKASNYTLVKNARVELERDPNDDSIAAAEKTIATISKREGLEQKTRREIKKLRKLVGDTKMKFKTTRVAQQSQQDFIRLKNRRRNKPNDVEGNMKAAKAFIAKYPNSPELADAGDILEQIEADATMSVERRALAAVEAKVNELVWSKRKSADREFRLAWDALHGVDSTVESIYVEELTSMRDRVWGKSQAAMGVHKNEVRKAIRDGRHSDAKSMVDELLDKLVTGTIEAYLKFPDGGYTDPQITKNEAETQVLLREGLKRFK